MRYLRLPLAALLMWLVAAPSSTAAGPGLSVGDRSPDFTLKTLEDQEVSLAGARARGPVVLVMLRGWPGYQCPICTRQVGELLAQKDALQTRGATVILVYPGPAAQLSGHAREFIANTRLPAHFRFVTDPGYTMVNAWKLRWDAPKETAYPSAFVIDKQGLIHFAKVSQTHGGRAKTADILAALDQLTEK